MKFTLDGRVAFILIYNKNKDALQSDDIIEKFIVRLKSIRNFLFVNE